MTDADGRAPHRGDPGSRAPHRGGPSGGPDARPGGSTAGRGPAGSPAIFKYTRTARGRLSRLNIVMFLPLLAVVGALLVAMDARTWWQAVVLGLGVVAALVAFVRWAARDISRVALPCLVVTAAVWAAGALVIGSDTAFYGISVVGSLSVPQLPRHRGWAALGVGAYVGAVGAARLLVTPEHVSDVLIPYVIIPAGFTSVLIGLMFPNQRFYGLVAEMEEEHEREAELAVMRERMRFASDLHDIQGHTLHVVKLKIALAQKLVHSDTGRVEQELREVHALVSDTIAQTKALAYAQRRLNLSAELENAKNLFEAAGIRVRVDREAEVDAHAGELLGQVLRETTTNILRHAQAGQVRITLSESGITIVNDGAREDPPPELRGLATLRERVVNDGGELTVEQKDGRFLTAATFPHGRSNTAP
ncbi:histidine kinase [Streptosporangium sp. NPDC002524]|uniref:sensor histidine kinase n=1 Tax=Streptosporangium sp. NPDC002524 TaxID=3154537 RepID=UPI003329F2FC